jgi:hypothetical protein
MVEFITWAALTHACSRYVVGFIFLSEGRKCNCG